MTPNQRLIILVLFTLSGATGLVYEAIWTQYLKLFLGHSSYAQAVVLVLFMGGLTIGAAVVSRRITGIVNPLRAYALVELLIGVLAISFHFIYQFVTSLVHEHLPGTELITFYKLAASALLVLPASMLLGSTFPLMVSGVLRYTEGEQSGRSIATLYFANSFGAAFGVLISGFVLLEWFGLPGTIQIAGLINLALAVAVFQLAKRPLPDRPQEEFPGYRLVPSMAWLLLFVSFATGFASFVYEIAWIRMLSLVLGASTHAFELMLSAFILGLALGGFFVRLYIDQLKQPVLILGVIQIVMGLLAMFSMLAYEQTFNLMRWMVQSLPADDSGYGLYNVMSHGLAMLVMLPTTICAGMTLPLITHILYSQNSDERVIGRVYAVNTVGAILGVLLSVQVLMPSIGLQDMLTLGAITDVLVGVGLIVTLNASYAVGLGVTGLIVMTLVYRQVDFATELLASGVFRTGEFLQEIKPVFHRDGKTATVDVVDTGQSRMITTNGKPDASISLGNRPAADEVTMSLLSVIPLLLRPDSEYVSMIGMGSGVSSATILASKRVKRMDTIEIEPAMVEGARFFGEKSARVFSDSRSNIVIDDAKTYFVATDQQYDLIISEPSNPWVSGVASVFSLEFYDQVSKNLVEDGLFVQWLHLYESNPSLVFSILNALEQVFPHYRMYTTVLGDSIIVAGQSQIPELSEATIGDYSDILSPLGVLQIDDLRAREVVSSDSLDAADLIYPEVNSDYYPYLDLNSAKARFLQQDANSLLLLRTYPLPVAQLLAGQFQPNDELVITTTASTANSLLDAAIRAKRQIETPKVCDASTSLDNHVLALAHSLPYLSPEEMESALAKLDCDEDDATRHWRDWLLAVSHRNLEGTWDPAVTLLGMPGTSRTAGRMLAESLAMSHLAVGDYDQVLAVFQKYRLVDQATPLPVQLMYMQAIRLGTNAR